MVQNFQTYRLFTVTATFTIGEILSLIISKSHQGEIITKSHGNTQWYLYVKHAALVEVSNFFSIHPAYSLFVCFFFNFTCRRLKRTYVNNFAMQINPASCRVVEELEPNDLGLVVGALQLIWPIQKFLFACYIEKRVKNLRPLQCFPFSFEAEDCFLEVWLYQKSTKSCIIRII